MNTHIIRGRRGAPQRVAVGLMAAAVLALSTSACDGSSTSAPVSTAPVSTRPATTRPAPTEPLVAVDDDGTTSIGDEDLAAQLDDLTLTTLSVTDRDALVFMREEEKLALDVYDALYGVWNLRIFDNISSAEQTHTESVRTLLDRYDIADPAVDQPAGTFTNPDLQALYDELVARGSESIVEALHVGALIEDLDIADLRARASSEPAIDLVFANLEKGSRNHLRAFVEQLDANGATYTPDYISQEAFDAIVGSPTERGRGQ